MNTPFDYQDLPFCTLLEYQSELQQRLYDDTHRLRSVTNEITRRQAQSVDILATRDGKIRPTESHAEQAE